MLPLSIALLVLTVFGIMALFVGFRRTGVVPMPSSASTRATVARIVSDYPDLRRITDLGAGWGGLTRHLAQAHCAPELVAVELSILPHLVGRTMSRLTHPGRVQHLHTDIRSVPLTRGCFITYLSRQGMHALRERFDAEQPRGGLLVSIAFAMPGWTPTRVERAADLLRTEVFVYEY